MIRTVPPLAASAFLALAAWASSAATPAALPAFADSVDAWEGLCDSATAIETAATLKMPCLIGPGARRPPQLDSIVAGSGTLRVVRVTDYSATENDSTLRAAVDSAEAWSDGKSCTVIIFPVGGTARMRQGGTQNADDSFECVYISGAPAQGEGINITDQDFRGRGGEGLYLAYHYTRSPGFSEGWMFHSSSDQMFSANIYIEHTSRSWYNRDTGVNLITAGCGTDVVPGTVICNDITVAYNALFEPDSIHPTFLNFVTKRPSGLSRSLVYRNFMSSGGQRVPNVGGDSMQAVSNVSYNIRNYAAHLGNEDDTVRARVDWLDNYLGTGPVTTTDDNSGWAIYFTTLNAGSEALVNIKGQRQEQNDYALDTPVDSLWNGSKRVVACDADITLYPGFCGADGDSLPGTPRVTDTMRLATFIGIPEAEPTITPMTDSLRDRIVQIAGNSRYLACDGEWTLRADSVDVRMREEIRDTTGISSLSDLNTDTDRSYGTPASGTACPDSDLDGLPDAYELDVSGSSTSLDPASVVNDLPVILWFLSGRQPNGGLVGCNGTCSAEAGAISPTFGAVARYVYVVPTRTFFGLTVPDFDLLEVRFQATNPAGDSIMVVSCTQQGAPADSASLDARLQAWSRPSFAGAVAVRDFDPPYGMEC